MADFQNHFNTGIIVTRTPLRVSFAGGGTDLAVFYEHDYGAVLSTTIDKYVYVTVKRHSELFGEPIRLNYSETEQVKRVQDIKNGIARECLRFLQVEPPVYISTVSDVPAASGLGSSSAFTVGLLSALHIYNNETVSAGQLAEEAAHIEIDVLKRPIGKQDHYAAAFGGFNFFRFLSNGGVSAEPQRFANNGMNDLFAHMMMFWTGMTRDSHSVLSEQKSKTRDRMSELTLMREHAHKLQRLMLSGFNAVEFGQILNETWQFKCRLASRVTNDRIDHWYRMAMKAGALGGKLCGAGGGGFMLFIVPPDHQASVRGALSDLSEISVRQEPQGSRVLMPHTE
jgi:D-glycero-alpha-D-manno-heptose-7-phosphate kinase